MQVPSFGSAFSISTQASDAKQRCASQLAAREPLPAPIVCCLLPLTLKDRAIGSAAGWKPRVARCTAPNWMS